MLLWDYQDKGFKYYQIKTNGDNCEECNNLEGKKLLISEGEIGINLPPFHPNCDCTTQIIDNNGNVVFSITDEAKENDTSSELSYLQTSIKQIVLGNYSDDATLLGTIGQIALGFFGLDLPADIRDLIYDITNFKLTPSHALQTLLDVASLLPVIGSLKYSDEVIDAAKKADNLADSIKYTNKISTISDNVRKMEKEYPINANGYFGKKGKNCRIIESNDPIKTSADFYKKLSQGGIEEPLPNGKGVQTIFDDGSRVIYRVNTSTPNSPAIDIKINIYSGIKKQKIHFIK